MQKYSTSFAEDLAMFHILKPLALAVGDGPAAAENAKYLGVLHAFMEPLAELYQSLDPENPLSEEEIKEQASDVARDIVERFTEEVRRRALALALGRADHLFTLYQVRNTDYQQVVATDQVAYSLSLLLCCLNMSYVGSHVEAIRMGKENRDTAWPSKEKMRRDSRACIQGALNEVFRTVSDDPKPEDTRTTGSNSQARTGSGIGKDAKDLVSSSFDHNVCSPGSDNISRYVAPGWTKRRSGSRLTSTRGPLNRTLPTGVSKQRGERAGPSRSSSSRTERMITELSLMKLSGDSGPSSTTEGQRRDSV
jgi:hypothetical protein